MKKRGGIRKGAGRARGKKPTPPVDVDESAVMTLRQVADYLHCSYNTARRLAKHGKIPGFAMGGSWRFLKSEVDQWIAKGGGQPSGSAAAKTHGGRRGPKPKPKTAKS